MEDENQRLSIEIRGVIQSLNESYKSVENWENNVREMKKEVMEI